jgi:hypothetical protein
MLRYSPRSFWEEEAKKSGKSFRELYKGYLDQSISEWWRKNPDFYPSQDGMPVSDIRQYEYLTLVAPAARKAIFHNLPKVIFTHFYSSFGAVFSTWWHRYNTYILHNKLDLRSEIRGNIFRLIKGDVKGGVKGFFAGKHSYIQLLSFIWTIANFILATIGFIIILKSEKSIFVYIFLALVLYHIFIGGVDAMARLRVPILPYIFGMSGFALTKFFRGKNKEEIISGAVGSP